MALLTLFVWRKITHNALRNLFKERVNIDKPRYEDGGGWTAVYIIRKYPYYNYN